MNAGWSGAAWLAIAAGPFVGSFLAVVAIRLPAGANPLTGRSRCPHCGHTLAARDLVPILSWAVHRGRCRRCGAALGAFYPAMEVAATAVAVWAAAVVPGWLVWPSCVLGWMLLTLAAIDQRHLILPDVLVAPLGLAGLATAWAIDAAVLAGHLVGALAGVAAFAVVAWLYRRIRGRDGLGAGDAKLLGAAGAWVSWQGLPTVIVLAAASALASILVTALAGTAAARWARARGYEAGRRADDISAVPVPFGPHLGVATWLTWLYGSLVVG